MADLNVVVLIGNLTRDPEVRYAPSGDAVGDLQLAVNRRYRTRDGKDQEETCFIGVVVWGRQAETCGQYLRKGSLVCVEGRLQYDQWEKDGQKQSRIRVRANRVQFLNTPRSGDDSRQGQDRQPGGYGTPSDTAQRQEAPPPAGERTSPSEQTSPAELADDDNLPF